MSKRQKIALGVGGGLLVLCLLFPPWVVTGYSIFDPVAQSQERHHAGYASIFVPPAAQFKGATPEQTKGNPFIDSATEYLTKKRDTLYFDYKIGNRTFSFLQRPQPQVQIDILRLSIQSIVVLIVTAVTFFLLKGP